MGLEATKLRVTPIAPCFSAKDRPSQKRLAPECHEALRIEVLGMKSPKSHLSWQLTLQFTGALDIKRAGEHEMTPDSRFSCVRLHPRRATIDQAQLLAEGSPALGCTSNMHIHPDRRVVTRLFLPRKLASTSA